MSETCSFYKIKEGEKILIADKVRIADSFWTRFKGLMFTKSLDENQGLWISSCNSVHMSFMRYPIDVLFLNKENCIESVLHSLKPWFGFGFCKKAESCLELAAGTAERFNLASGDNLISVKNPSKETSI